MDQIAAGGPSLPPFLQQIVAQATDAAVFARVTRNEHVAVYTVLVYDWLLCLEQERSLLSRPGSRRGISIGKVAYLFCRYWPLLTHPITIWVQVMVTTPELCSKTFQVPLLLSLANFAGAAGVLVVRVYAFTGARRTVAVFLVLCFLVVLAYELWAVSSQITFVPEIPACFPADKHQGAKTLSGYFLAPFLFDLVATATFVIHAVRVRLDLVRTSGVITVFIREGAAYFIAISTINLANAVMNYQHVDNHRGVLAALSMLLPNILACRLVINLWSSANTSYASHNSTAGGIRFVHPPRAAVVSDEERPGLDGRWTGKEAMDSNLTAYELAAMQSGRPDSDV